MTIRGHIERVDEHSVVGWAFSLSDPGSRIDVVARDRDGVVIGSASANIFRPDLLKAGIGDGIHAFTILKLPGREESVVASVTGELSGEHAELGWGQAARDGADPNRRRQLDAVRALNLRLQLDEAESLARSLGDDPVVKRLVSTIAANRKRYDYSTIGARLGAAGDRDGLAAGSWIETRSDRGLLVQGIVCDGSPKVFLFCDERLFKVVDVQQKDGTPRFGSFSFLIRGALDYFPKKFVLSVASAQGVLVHQQQLEAQRSISIETGSGKLDAALADGYVVEMHGDLVPLQGTRADWQGKRLAWYDKARPLIADRLGKDLMFIYGTLLGIIRDDGFIAHDGDVDCCYISSENTPERVRDETFAAVCALAEHGCDIDVVLKGAFFRPLIDNVAADVFPAWFDDGRLWMHNTTSIPAARDILDPPREIMFKDRPVLVPNDSAAFLRMKYGADWMSPDPSYVARAPNPHVSGYLRKSCFTSAQLAHLRATFGDRKRGTGKVRLR